METFDRIYIGGRFVTPHGTETLTLTNPTTRQPASVLRLGDEVDAQAAIAAARAAAPGHARSTLQARGQYLQRLHDAVKARERELVDVMVEEYGGPVAVSTGTVRRAAASFLLAKETMERYPFERSLGRATVRMEPLGVAGLITPWNASYGFVCGKLAMALAAGCTAVIKPSELSAAQTQLLLACLHAAELPPGLLNVVNGRGDRVGAELSRHPGVDKISFTGSTGVGKAILRAGAETLKRVTLELGGKSANVLLDDADLDVAIPLALSLAYMNSGQACIAGTRLLIPAARRGAVEARLRAAVAAVRVGDPRRPETQIGPLVTQKQYERVQGYIRLGLEEGATLLAGGEGPPEGAPPGYFVRPTIFTGVTPQMRIAQEEIFGPVLAVMTYEDDADAVRIANGTAYGLHAYVSGEPARARRIAESLVAGRVFVNGMYEEPLAPFGGFRQSGLGREFGSFGLEAYLEPKTLV